MKLIKIITFTCALIFVACKKAPSRTGETTRAIDANKYQCDHILYDSSHSENSKPVKGLVWSKFLTKTDSNNLFYPPKIIGNYVLFVSRTDPVYEKEIFYLRDKSTGDLLWKYIPECKNELTNNGDFWLRTVGDFGIVKMGNHIEVLDFKNKASKFCIKPDYGYKLASGIEIIGDYIYTSQVKIKSREFDSVTFIRFNYYNGNREYLFSHRKTNFTYNFILTSTGTFALNSNGDSIVHFRVTDMKLDKSDDRLKIMGLNLRTKKPEWESQNLDSIRNFDGYYFNSLVNGLIIITSMKNVYGLDPQSGEVKWKFELESNDNQLNPCCGGTCCFDKYFLFRTSENGLYCLDVTNGKLKYKLNDVGYLSGYFNQYDGVAYFANDNMIAIDIPTGRLLGTCPIPSKWLCPNDIFSMANGIRSVVMDPKTGYIYSADRTRAFCMKNPLKRAKK